MGKIVIVERNHKFILFLFDDKGHSELISPFDLEEKEHIGSIYSGRISEVTEGLQAAFVQINQNQKVFLPFSECGKLCLINREYDGKLKQGDELLVQIEKPAVKTKPPTATTELTLTGHYCICRFGGHGINYSKKLKKNKIEELKLYIEKYLAEHSETAVRKNCGFVVRTNAGNVDDYASITMEMEEFAAFFQNLTAIYKHRTCFTCFYHGESELIKTIHDISFEDYDEIITDQKEIFDSLSERGLAGLRMYNDPMLSLGRLYSIETHLKQALASKIWLPGGGYLVIEPTEAMLVIDVNTGKASNLKGNSQQKTYYKTNLEAAEEIARQLRIRNYSGMIMVDFINMEAEEDNQSLLAFLEEKLKKDKVKTRLVDMTALGIVEITRKKVSKQLDISIL